MELVAVSALAIKSERLAMFQICRCK